MRYFALAFFALLAGCASAPYHWERVDKRPIESDLALIRQAKADIIACRGEVDQTLLLANPNNNASADAAMNVLEGCMARRGYLYVPDKPAAAH